MNSIFLKTVGFKPYQQAWLMDRSPFKIGLWARQTGKDFTTAAEAVLDCFERPKTHWLVLASGERQALETLRKAVEWTHVFDMEIAHAGQYSPEPQALITSAEIRWPNGSRLTAIPAKPETIRGYSANLLLTEFAFHEDPDAIWRAIYPTITNPLRGGFKKIRIISTPNGRGNRFHHLWENSRFSKHKVTIHDAVEDGMPLDVEQLRLGLDDPEAWAQEYECEFMDTSSILLPYDLIQSCEAAEASHQSDPEALSRLAGPLFVGIDFGRRNNLTVSWTLELQGDILWTREVLILDNLSTPDQAQALRPRLARARRACLDYTGAGIGLGDYLARDFGEWKPASQLCGKIELCFFSQSLKAELFPKLRAAFEAKKIRIPIQREIREDLHGIHKIVTNSGNISYRAACTADGHSDRCTALALALRAAADYKPSTGASVIHRSPRPFPRSQGRHR